MAWSKSTRITIMLGIDTAFFVLELGVGLIVGSLALMADAFHMVSKIEGVGHKDQTNCCIAERYYLFGRWSMGCEGCIEIIDRQIYVWGQSKTVSGWDLMLNDCSGYGQKSSAPSSMPFS